MRAVLQRVTEASVTWAGGRASIGPGLVILLGVGTGDGEREVTWLAEKCAALRIFSDEAHHMNRSVRDAGGEVLVVSQFTLLADCRKGRRPSFEGAMAPAGAEPLYERFVAGLREIGLRVETGAFGAMMEVALVNDGPVTIVVDTP